MAVCRSGREGGKSFIAGEGTRVVISNRQHRLMTHNRRFKTLSFIATLMVVVALWTVHGCSPGDSETSPERPESHESFGQTASQNLPEYEIVQEEEDDSPLQAQVEQHIVVSKDIDEQGVRAVLEYQHSRVSSRTDFDYHDAPTSIYLYVYEDEQRARADQGLWIGMSQMGPDDSGPEVTIRSDQIARLGEEASNKFGLTESKRRALFREIARVEDEAVDEAMERYPQDIDAQLGYERRLAETKKIKLAQQYGVDRAILDSVSLEGVVNRWAY